ncbi:hypothetical protein [Leptospira sp. GIMC2001]|uniref:hypothetical protein n=1 Tax=Leptospira sp. GIMC2001 TaxID=1513297 RepID=UPI00234A62D5|nr:hypothetical protein [Leptospira sp. GIMC2001]WCL51274.1 hypothetical protein O4O04_10825 [Leptospira sp. GIMC2001]
MGSLILFNLLFKVIFISLTGYLLIYSLAYNYFYNDVRDGKINNSILVFVSIPFLGVVMQYLAWLQLFSIWIFLACWFLIFLLNRKRFSSIIHYLFNFKKLNTINWNFHNITKIICFSVFFIVIILHLVRILEPSINIDIFFYHLPIAKKIAMEGGFNLPLHVHPYYANQPAFADFLFAMGFLLETDYRISHAINYFIFISFLVMIINLVPKKRYYYICLIPIFLIFSDNLFLSGALTGMVDTTRACLGVGGLIVLIYNIKPKSLLLFLISGVCLGGDVASKYLGMIPMLFGFIILLFLYYENPKRNGKGILYFLFGFSIVIGPWYIKNLILFLNPIYPYIFGHPGLSDQWMADLMIEQTKSFDISHRFFRREFLELNSWIDLFSAINQMFLSSFGIFLSSITVFSIIIVKNRIFRILILLSFIHFIIWYFMIFNSSRFGISAYLLFLSSMTFAFSALAADITKSLKNSIIILIICLLCFYGMSDNLIQKFKNSLAFEFFRGDVTEEVFMSKSFPEYRIMKYMADSEINKIWIPLGVENEIYMPHLFELKTPISYIVPYSSPKNKEQVCELNKSEDKLYFVLKNNVSSIQKERLDEVAGSGYSDFILGIAKELEKNSNLLVDEESSKLYSITKVLPFCKL